MRMANSTVIPSLAYKDAHAAIDFLVRAFGFHKQAVYEDSGTVAHAQLTLGGGMIMIGSSKRDSSFASRALHPDETAGKFTHGIYLQVPDCTTAHAQALAAGAVIMDELREMEYGGKGFSCKDPEGYLWSLGEYNPWP